MLYQLSYEASPEAGQVRVAVKNETRHACTLATDFAQGLLGYQNVVLLPISLFVFVFLYFLFLWDFEISVSTSFIFLISIF